jgi:glucose-6-phosphate isomerase
MDLPTQKLTASSEWQALASHARQFDDSHLRDIVAADEGRAERLSVSAVGLHLDFSSNWITDQTLTLMGRLAEARGLDWWRQALFDGQPVNHTEHRVAGHPALRMSEGDRFLVDGQDVMPAILASRARMAEFAEAVREGRWTGATGEAIRDVVHIGIGGSHLGPQLCCEALSGISDTRIHFLSSGDPVQFDDLVAGLDAAHTLFIVASKSFGTAETLSNASLARSWLAASLGEGHEAEHFIAVTAAVDAAVEFGIPEVNVFELWDWVGGRYSLWSAIGLPILIHAGAPAFEAMLDGARAMDQHFLTAPTMANMPVVLALLDIWYRNFHGCQSRAVLPYVHRLRHLPDHLQQLEMESLGKTIDRDGERVDYDTGGIVFGNMGNEAQHAFFQLLHQGTTVIPMDIIVPTDIGTQHADSEKRLRANAQAQAQALVQGRTGQEVAAEFDREGLPQDEAERLLSYKLFEGGRPSNTITLERLTADHLGALLALYEHKVFVQSVIWNLNPFDQWGVELGKQIAAAIHAQES